MQSQFKTQIKYIVLFSLLAEKGITERNLFETRCGVKFEGEQDQSIKIHSPLRDDKNKSASAGIYKGKYFLSDFGLDFPGRENAKNLNYINIIQYDCQLFEKGGYYKAIEQIAIDYGIKEEFDKRVIQQQIGELPPCDKIVFGQHQLFLNHSYCDYDLSFWAKFNISESILLPNNVKSVAGYVYNRDNHEFFIKSSPDKPIFAYFPEGYCKIYLPYNREQKCIYLEKSDTVLYCFGLNVRDEGKITILAAGEKDCMVLQSLGFNAICVNSESAIVPLELVKKFHRKPFPLAILYDNDETGKAFSFKWVKQYGLAHIQLPDLDGVKDAADYIAAGNCPEALRELIIKSVNMHGEIGTAFLPLNYSDFNNSGTHDEVKHGTINLTLSEEEVMAIIITCVPWLDCASQQLQTPSISEMYQIELDYIKMEQEWFNDVTSAQNSLSPDSQILLPIYVYKEQRKPREVLLKVNGHCLLSKGNICVISGPPKVFKTTFLNTIVRLFLSTDTDKSEDIGLQVSSLLGNQSIVSMIRSKQSTISLKKVTF